MNPAFLGDSYDLVKRVFVQELRVLGYEVGVEPFFTGDWDGAKKMKFHQLTAARHRDELAARAQRTALLLDPDTGVKELGSAKHVSFRQMEAEVDKHQIVFAFDQSFSRNAVPKDVMQDKLDKLRARNVYAMYYDSHARFLFASRAEGAIKELRTHLQEIVGLPDRRFVVWTGESTDKTG